MRERALIVHKCQKCTNALSRLRGCAGKGVWSRTGIYVQQEITHDVGWGGADRTELNGIGRSYWMAQMRIQSMRTLNLFRAIYHREPCDQFVVMISSSICAKHAENVFAHILHLFFVDSVIRLHWWRCFCIGVGIYCYKLICIHLYELFI